MTEKEAAEMIEQICKWLEAGTDKKDISTAVDIAREFCDKLLVAAGADGEGGCHLCQN